MKKLLVCMLTLAVLLTSVVAVISVTAADSGTSWGDVNGDGGVNLKDVLALRRHVAGMEALANEAAGDLDFDGAINLKDVLLLRKFIANMIDAPTMTEAEPTATGTTPTGAEPYRYNDDGEPVLTFLDGVDDCSLGVWWWQVDDGQNERTREKYLDFLEENGTTEIYYYCVYDMVSSYGRQTTHDFVLAAKEHGMKVVPLYDDVGMINGVEQCDVPVSKMISMFKAYNETYPDAPLDMIHFDVEPHQVFQDKNIKHLTERELTLYAENFLGGIQALRESGIKVEAALNCTWNNYGGENVEFGGEKGIYNICAKYLDSMCMMAYRDTAEDIMAIGQPGFDAAMKYGTRITYGIETGHYSFNKVEEEFAQESKEYMYTEFAKVFDALRDNHPTGGYGLAVHYHRTWLTMNKEADLT